MTDPESFDWLTLDGGESLLWSGHPRRVSIVWLALFVAVGVAVVAVFAEGYAVLAAVGGVVLVVWQYLRLVNTEYVLTDRNVYEKTGVLGESITRVGLDRIQNTDLSKNVFGSYFGFGTVEVSTAGGSGPELRVANVNGAGEVRELLGRYAKEAGTGTGSVTAGSGPADAALDGAVEEARALRRAAESLEAAVAGPEDGRTSAADAEGGR